MYNCMNAAYYLAKLTYEISLSCMSVIQKSLLRKSLTMHTHSKPSHAVRGAFTALA